MKYYVWLTLIFSLFVHAEDQIPRVTVYAYHDKPPYIIDRKQEKGLYYDLVRFLNGAGTPYQFTLEYAPRKRIERLITQNDFQGLLIGVNPHWFDDADEQKFHWTRPVFHDEDIFVSTLEKPFEYVNDDSYFGAQVCLVLGNYYRGLSEAISAGSVRQLTTNKEGVIFDMLNQRRCGFGIVSRSLYDYLKAVGELPDYYYVASTVHDSFDRRILVPHANTAVFFAVDLALKQWSAAQ